MRELNRPVQAACGGIVFKRSSECLELAYSTEEVFNRNLYS